MAWFTIRIRGPRLPSSSSLHSRPHLEALESRIVPYSVTGNSWPYPQLVTISFVPDGTQLTANNQSNLFATLNARFGNAATWQNIILKAAQVWAQQTNVNFALISDNGTAAGGGSYQQGDPGMGDIRVGGYNFGTSDLAGTSYPPPANNFSIAGDIDFNTGQPWNNNGQNYDLFTVAAHEMGHALGMGHSSTTYAVMYAYYNRVKSSLNSDDISGIRSIYSGGNARSPGAYEPDGSFAQAANITSQISNLTALITGIDVTTAGELEYYTFTVPSGTSGTMVVKVQSSGLSLLAPTLTVYNSSDQQIGYQSGAGQYGTTLSVTITGVSSGQQYYVKVAGADSTAFGTGAYAMTLNFGTGSNPTVPLPNTQDPNGNPLHSGGGTPEKALVDDGVHQEVFPSTPESASTQTNAATIAGSPSTSVVVVSARVPFAAVSAPSLNGLSIPVVRPAVGGMAPSVPAIQPYAPGTGSRVESGGGEESSDVPSGAMDLDDLRPSLPALPGPEVVPQAPAAAGSELAWQSRPDLQNWRALASRCFSESPVLRSQPAETAGPVNSGPVLNYAAASAILLVALGSYWNTPAADPDRFPRRAPRT